MIISASKSVAHDVVSNQLSSSNDPYVLDMVIARRDHIVTDVVLTDNGAPKVVKTDLEEEQLEKSCDVSDPVTELAEIPEERKRRLARERQRRRRRRLRFDSDYDCSQNSHDNKKKSSINEIQPVGPSIVHGTDVNGERNEARADALTPSPVVSSSKYVMTDVVPSALSASHGPFVDMDISRREGIVGDILTDTRVTAVETQFDSAEPGGQIDCGNSDTVLGATLDKGGFDRHGKKEVDISTNVQNGVPKNESKSVERENALEKKRRLARERQRLHRSRIREKQANGEPVDVKRRKKTVVLSDGNGKETNFDGEQVNMLEERAETELGSGNIAASQTRVVIPNWSKQESNGLMHWSQAFETENEAQLKVNNAVGTLRHQLVGMSPNSQMYVVQQLFVKLQSI